MHTESARGKINQKSLLLLKIRENLNTRELKYERIEIRENRNTRELKYERVIRCRSRRCRGSYVGRCGRICGCRHNTHFSSTPGTVSLRSLGDHTRFLLLRSLSCIPHIWCLHPFAEPTHNFPGT